MMIVRPKLEVESLSETCDIVRVLYDLSGCLSSVANGPREIVPRRKMPSVRTCDGRSIEIIFRWVRHVRKKKIEMRKVTR